MPGKPKTDNKLGDSLEPVFKAVEDYMREVTKLYGMPQEGDTGFERAIELAGQLGAITIERMNELEEEWRRHMPHGGNEL